MWEGRFQPIDGVVLNILQIYLVGEGADEDLEIGLDDLAEVINSK